MRRVVIFVSGVAVGLGLALTLLSPWKAAAEGAGVSCVPGDANGDGKCNLADPVYLLHYLFNKGPEPAVCLLPATGQERCYDQAGNVIDCASADFPGQGGFYRAGCPNEGRFVDNGDGTISDRCTGLVWRKATAPGRYTLMLH